MLINHPTIAVDTVRPTHVEVDLGRLKSNFQKIREYVHPANMVFPRKTDNLVVDQALKLLRDLARNEH